MQKSLLGLALVVTIISLEARTPQAPNACIFLSSRTIPVLKSIKMAKEHSIFLWDLQPNLSTSENVPHSAL